MTTSFKARLAEPRILLAPGIFNAFSALLAERAGHEALYLSGASIAYMRLGRPDIGLVSLAEVVDTVATIRDRSNLPLIVDADTGFGNALNVQRTVRMLERAAAGGPLMIQLEDQVNPKRCGHLDGKAVISGREHAGKIRAAVDARLSPETLILARTDAIAVEGFEAALDRASLFREAGADALFVEALRDEQQMRTALGRFPGVPMLANMVEGGKSPLLSAAELQAMGFRIVIFPGGLARSIARTAETYFATLKAEGTTANFRDRMLDFSQLQTLLGTPEMLAHGKRYEE